jgi:predicted RND superfamily exporter protein
MKIKESIAILGALFVLIAGVWGARTILATAGDLEKTKNEITHQSVQTFDKMQSYIDKRFALQELIVLKNREDILLESLEKNPKSQKIQKEYEKTTRQIEKIEFELKQLKDK